MFETNEQPILLAMVINQCVEAVKVGKPYDAEPWIMIEDEIGYEETKKLFSSSVYRDVANMLDLFCHSAQHDSDYIGEIPIGDVGKRLLQLSEKLPEVDTSLLL